MSKSGSRPSPISGLWYEGNPESLSESIDGFLENAKLPELNGKVVALMSPHAGHLYSGAVAGYAFAAVRGLSPDVVVVIGPMHHPYTGSILASGHNAYSTPLGDIPVDQDFIHQLNIILTKEFHSSLTTIERDKEHSIEIVLPFLQRALQGNWSLVPIMVREQTPQISEYLGKALARILKGRNFLLVASTDLSHFFNETIACQLDSEMLRQVESFSPLGIFTADRKQKGFACGLGALAAVLIAAKELDANKVQVLKHATSGEITGDYDSVVGYGAAVVLNTSR
jgi:MEMO1 family protein